MKILLGCSAPPDRGSGILAYAKDLTDALLKMGAEVHFASPTPRDFQWLQRSGLHHVATDQHHDPRLRTAQLARYVAEQAIEGVINNDNPWVQSIAPTVSCPFIAVGHMSKSSIASLACYQPQWSDYVVAISGAMRRAFVMKHAVPASRCPIVYTGVADPGEPPRRVPAERGELRLLFAGGSNTRLKGADLLWQALALGARHWQGIRLDWFGDLPTASRSQLEAYGFVKVHGRVSRDRLLNAMRASDVLLLPSRYEGCPMTMLEAMSHGVVPIASDGVGAMSALITSGREGFICHLDDWPRQMLESIAFLREHPAILDTMRQRTRERYLAEFQSTAVAARLLDLLRQPVVDRRTPARKFDALRWHRPLRKDGRKSPLLDRVCIRFGWLRKAGRVAAGADLVTAPPDAETMARGMSHGKPN